MTEGTSSNVYVVKKNVIYTHPVTTLILNGITRKKVLQLCEKHGLNYEEKAVTKDELLNADEVFITSTTAEVIPVTSIDGQTIGSGAPGPLTKMCRPHCKTAFCQRQPNRFNKRKTPLPRGNGVFFTCGNRTKLKRAAINIGKTQTANIQ